MGKVSKFLVLITVGLILLSCSLPDVSITSISITSDTLTMEEGETQQLNYSVLPSNRTETFYLSTTNKFVVQIDGNGIITAVAPGTAVIKIYNSSNTIFDTCTVIVNPKTYYVKEKIIKNNFESYISDVFYLRNEDGSLDKNYMKTNIIVIKILFTNNRLESVPIAPSFFTLINNYDQHNHCYSYGYDPDGKFVSLNDRFDMVSGTSRTMYFAFCDYSEIVNSNYRINCENNHNYDFNVSFSLSEIR